MDWAQMIAAQNQFFRTKPLLVAMAERYRWKSSGNIPV